MKAKLRKRLQKIETTLKELATEIGLLNPPLQLPSRGLTGGDDRGKPAPLEKSKALGKTAQKARKKIKGVPEGSTMRAKPKRNP